MNREGVLSTNQEATLCKAYATQKGYISDDFVAYFCNTQEKLESRTPEISLGHFCRVNTIKAVVQNFLKANSGTPCQVINLGCGYDTLFWRLLKEMPELRSHSSAFTFIDVDFPEVVAHKSHVIKRNEKMYSYLDFTGENDLHKSPNLHSRQYHLIAADISNIEVLKLSLSTCTSFSHCERATFIICECFLVYLNFEESQSLLNWLYSYFKDSYLAILTLDQTNMQDNFGLQMINNLKSRNVLLLGVDFCGNVMQQKNRFLDIGFESVEVKLMSEMYKLMPAQEIWRVNQIENLDEQEVLFQLLDHYAFILAQNSSSQPHILQLNSIFS